MDVLELYSGIGGMHMAFFESGVNGEIKAAIEINNVAVNIYEHNFKHTKLLNLNIEGLTSDTINKLNVNTILMSPPCQPFTRNGNQNDIKDSRTNSFRHILDLLSKLSTITNILIENVKGFERSQMRDILVESLKKNDYIYQEFILSPSQFGISNCRYRYYCLAKKLPNRFKFDIQNTVMETFPLEIEQKFEPEQIGDIIDNNVDFEKYKLSDQILRKRINVLDICYRKSKQSCCFTKAYGRYIEGTGSVFSDESENYVKSKLKELKTLNNEDAEYLNIAKSLKLRFFTPKEISRLMCFPDRFQFPDSITTKQRYMVLGNSINVRIVSKLIKLLAN